MEAHSKNLGQRRFVAQFLPGTHALLKARQQAEELGYNPQELYEPWMLVDCMQQLVLALQHVVGSGSLAVVLTSLLLRGVTLPWNLWALQRQTDKIEYFPIFSNLSKAMAEAQKNGDALRLEELQKQYLEFMEHTKFSPFQGMSYVFCCQLPQFMLLFFTIRGIVLHPDLFRTLVMDQSIWLHSLALPDPYGILPAVSAAAILANVELNSPPQPKDAVSES